LREFDGEHCATRVKDDVKTWRKQIDVAAQSFAHAALDAIALSGFAQHFANGEADARRCESPRLTCHIGNLRSQKPAPGRGLPLAGSRIGALIVGVLAQTRSRQRSALSWPGK
jgi:hypothetical protein